MNERDGRVKERRRKGFEGNRDVKQGERKIETISNRETGVVGVGKCTLYIKEWLRDEARSKSQSFYQSFEAPLVTFFMFYFLIQLLLLPQCG